MRYSLIQGLASSQEWLEDGVTWAASRFFSGGVTAIQAASSCDASLTWFMTLKTDTFDPF